jgi:hypothetical protein
MTEPIGSLVPIRTSPPQGMIASQIQAAASGPA